MAGLLWGMLTAKLWRYKKVLQVFVAIFVLGLMSVAAFWQPWSIAWLSNRASSLFLDQKMDEAKIMYKKILAIDKGDTFAIANLKLIQVNSLEKAAFAAHKQGNYEEARKLYNQILAIDPENTWAKENMSILPAK